MNQRTYTSEEIGSLRDRAKYEDGLLNARTNIVLVFNGLLAAAANLPPIPPREDSGTLGVAVFALLFNALWAPCALQHGRYMAHLSAIIRGSAQKPLDEAVRFEHQRDRPYGPTGFMTVVVPIMLGIGWALWILLKATRLW